MSEEAGRQGARPIPLACLLNVLNFNFKSPEPLGQNVVDRRENDKEDETENAGEDRPKKINDAHDSEVFAAENEHRDASQSVHQTHQDIESSHDLAGLQNGYADQLLFHGLGLVERACFI